MSKTTEMACNLNESANNRYELVYQVVSLAKKLIAEEASLKQQEELGVEADADLYYRSNALKKEKPVKHAIMLKASEESDEGLIG